MKKFTLPLMMAGMMFVVSCSSPTADHAEVTDKVETTEVDGHVATVDTDASDIEWVGSKKLGKRHNGTIALESGEVVIEGDAIVGGNFVVNMNTITPLDQDEEGNTKLLAHLNSDDFFGVDKHPESSFIITSVSPVADASGYEMDDVTHTISGNLKIKGIEKNVTIPAKINVTDSDFSIHSIFNLIRTDFDVMFGNEDEADFKDDFINKEIHLTIHLQGNV